MTTTTTSIAQRSLCRMSRLYHHPHRILEKTVYSPATIHSQAQFHQTTINGSRHFHYSVPVNYRSSELLRSCGLHFQHTFARPLTSLSSPVLVKSGWSSRESSIGRNISSLHRSYREKANIPLTASHFSAVITPVRNMSSNKHLATGTPCPPLKEGMVRIYSMKYCPFAHRAVLVAEAKGIPYDIVNCNLKDKPEFLLEKNPQGEVPVLETNDGKVLYESLIVAEYLDEAFPQHRPLQHSDLYRRAIDKLYIEKYRSAIQNFYRLLFALREKESNDVLQEKILKFVEGLKPFEDELARRGTAFFAGDQPGMLDYMIWPWMERLPMIKVKLPDLFDYDEAKRQHPNLEKWRQAMKKDSAVSKLLISPEGHLKFAEGYLAGAPEYDL